MKKLLLVLGLLMMVMGMTETVYGTNKAEVTGVEEEEEQENEPWVEYRFFFPQGTKTKEYNVCINHGDECIQATLDINLIGFSVMGDIYSLKLRDTLGLPKEILDLGYYYVTDRGIYKMGTSREMMEEFRATGKYPGDIAIVCDETGYDTLSKEGVHERIIDKGRYREYLLTNEKDDLAICEEMIWEGGKGLISYRRESKSPELVDFCITSIPTDVEKQVTTYTSQKAGFRVDIPDSWKGKYVIEESNSGIKVYHLFNGQKGELLFEITCYGTREKWFEEGGAPYMYLAEHNGMIYVVRTISKISYDEQTYGVDRRIDDYLKLFIERRKVYYSIDFL